MDWFILIVLVPLIIVPIVLLFGFAGCEPFGEDVSATVPPPDAPFDLEATAVSETQIDLKWKHNSMGAMNFIVSLLGPDGVWNENHATVGDKSFSSKNLTAGTTFFYRVRATLGAGNDSARSNMATAQTWKWEVAYLKQFTNNDNAFPGDCMVQRIDKALLTYSGTVKQVKLTLRGSANAANAALAIDQVSISHAKTTAISPGTHEPSDWDSESTPKLLGAVSLPGNGSPVPLAPIDFVLDKTKDLIVAFDINGANTSATRRVIAGVGTSTCYTKNNVAEAAVENRTPNGWTTRAGSVYLVEKIDVLTG